MTRKVFLRWALLFLASNEKYSSIDSQIWCFTLKFKAKALLNLAEELNLIDDEPEQPP